MRLNVVAYIFQETFRSLKRNNWLNFAAAGTTAVSLFVLGIAILLVVNTEHIASTVESNVEIMVFLKQELPEDEVRGLRPKIAGIPGVEEVQFISRDEALRSLERQMGEGSNLRESLGGENPLPDAYKIRTREPQQVGSVAAVVGQLPGVEKVRYGQEVVEKLFRLTRWVRMIGMTVVALLGICAVFLIATTIRLTLFARRREINIMKYVGASDWFVRWPFLLEGVILGGVGALVAAGALYFSYNTLVSKLQETVTFLPLVNDDRVMLKIFEGILAAGAGLGIIGSFISVHRYLKV